MGLRIASVLVGVLVGVLVDVLVDVLDAAPPLFENGFWNSGILEF